MKVSYGKEVSEYGTGVHIDLTGDEVAAAIEVYLATHGIYARGPRTITVNGELCERGHVYVDPTGFVLVDGVKYSGRGPEDEVTRRIKENP